MTPLRHRMTEDMVIRNLAENTQSAYVQHVVAYARHFHRSPEELGPEEVRAYQVYLTQTRMLSPSSLSVATGALRFLYKVTLKRDWAIEEIPMPKRPFRLPVILSPEEVMHFLDSIGNHKHRTILMTAYAAGLRISEATPPKVTDIDSQRMLIRVEQAKGNKDRYTPLSKRLLDELRAYWRELFEREGVRLFVNWHKNDATHLAIADALRDVGGVSAIYQRSYESLPTWELTCDTDVHFSYSPALAALYRVDGSRIRYHVATGYLGDHRFAALREPARLLAEGQVRRRLEQVVHLGVLQGMAHQIAFARLARPEQQVLVGRYASEAQAREEATRLRGTPGFERVRLVASRSTQDSPFDGAQDRRQP